MPATSADSSPTPEANARPRKIHPMLLVKQELLGSLAAGLEKLFPGSGDKAVFESPKVAAHGDLACTAAMQLAKPLKQQSRARWPKACARPAGDAGLRALGRGHRDRRPRLPEHPAQARGQAADRARSAGRRRAPSAASPPTARRMMVEFVSANPTGPAARGPRPPGRAGRRHLQPVRHPGLGRLPRVLLQRRGRADRHARHLHPAARQGLQAGRPRVARGRLQRRLHRRHRRRLPGQEDGARPTTASSPPAATSTTSTRIRQFAVAYLRHEQDLDLQAFEVQFDNYYLESSLYTSGKVDAGGAAAAARPARPTSRTARCGCKSTDYGDDKDRVMRKSDGSYTYFVPDVAYHISQVGARLRQGGQHPGHRPPRHHRARARRPAGGRRRHSRRATPTTCCTPWCA